VGCLDAELAVKKRESGGTILKQNFFRESLLGVAKRWLVAAPLQPGEKEKERDIDARAD